MSTLPFAHGPFLWIEIGNYLLAAACLVVAWKHSRTIFGMMIGATLLGYALEFSQTTKTPPPYEYTQAIIGLPGNVPLGIILSWGTILFAVWYVIDSLGFGWLRHACAGGLLAVSIDFLSDPAFVFLEFWIWKEPVQYFGIPFSNFVGWFVIVASYFLCLRAIRHFFPPDKQSALVVVVLSVLGIVPAFLLFMVVMLAYVGLVELGLPWLPEPLVFTLFMVPPAVYVGWGLLNRQPASSTTTRDRQMERLALIVPAYLTLVSYLTLLVTSMHVEHPELVLIFPVTIAVVTAGFIWPLRQRA